MGKLDGLTTGQKVLYALGWTPLCFITGAIEFFVYMKRSHDHRNADQRERVLKTAEEVHAFVPSIINGTKEAVHEEVMTKIKAKNAKVLSMQEESIAWLSLFKILPGLNLFMSLGSIRDYWDMSKGQLYQRDAQVEKMLENSYGVEPFPPDESQKNGLLHEVLERLALTNNYDQLLNPYVTHNYSGRYFFPPILPTYKDIAQKCREKIAAGGCASGRDVMITVLREEIGMREATLAEVVAAKEITDIKDTKTPPVTEEKRGRRQKVVAEIEGKKEALKPYQELLAALNAPQDTSDIVTMSSSEVI